MSNRRHWILVACLALIAFGLRPLAAASSHAAPCVVGRGNGFWTLPDPSGANGSLNGLLTATKGQPIAYHITGKLTEFPSACLSCREGYVDGILDDGVGSTPDFSLHGHWIGSYLGGQGTWDATIYKQVGPAQIAVGEIRGSYNAPWSVTQGTFVARWGTCP
jgi:hypothetical protein